MNTKNLSKHYSALEPAERFSLMLAALARSDNLEYTRLTETAPQVSLRGIHTVTRVLAFEKMCHCHRMDQLALAAHYFKAQSLADLLEIRAVANSKHRESSSRLRDAARLYGYLVKIYAEGWTLFCERECLNSTIFEPAMSGDDVLEIADKDTQQERLTAFTPAEAHDYAKLNMDSEFQLKTAKLVANSLQDLYQRLVALSD